MESIETYNYLERIANLLRADIRKAGLEKSLQPIQLEALHYLGRCNRYSNTPASVTDYLGLTKGTVSQTLSVLESAGLIEKRADTKDKRVVNLILTDLGKQVLADIYPPKIMADALAILSESNQADEVNALFAKVLRALQQANQLKTFGVCRTCRYHQVEKDNSRFCNLTRETLSLDDAEKICREHGD